MSNSFLSVCYRKSMLLPFFLFQLLILLSTHSFQMNPHLNISIAIVTIVAYLVVVLKNPGFIQYGQEMKKPRPPIRSEPVISAPVQQPVVQGRFHPEINNLELQSKISETIQPPKSQQAATAVQQKIQDNVKYSEVKWSSIMTPKIQGESAKNEPDAVVEQKIPKKIILIEEKTDFTIIPPQLQKIQRWCRHCKHTQPLRARHCMQCDRCIATFDHHCPWMDNCIGQKNKPFFVLYFIIQTVQLILLSISLFQLMNKSIHNRQILVISIVCSTLALLSFLMVVFQFYLIAKNITTWQYLRWNRIQYLSIFDRKGIKSIFDRGILHNISITFKAPFIKQPIDWLKHVSSQAHKHVKLVGCQYGTDTDRQIA